jgi:hypothetical protein
MGKIVVKIVTAVGGAQASGGLADYRMLRPFKADVVKDTDVTGETGGVLPITQAQYDLVVA